MAKLKTRFFCQECGHEELKWLGKCPGCHAWNTMVEEVKTSGKDSNKSWLDNKSLASEPQYLRDITHENQTRVSTNIGEVDRVLGGGFVIGSLVLVGGDPGIGKSTVLLQVAKELGTAGHRILYISGEESAHQIKMRAERLGALGGDILLLTETNLFAIEEQILKIKPLMVIIDSIQTLYNPEVTSAAGSVSQVRECTASLLRLAKREGVAVFIVGHVTKEGNIAGPRVLEHMVDVVLYFEGEKHQSFRLLRGVKNRFGSTNEIGIFEMGEAGLLPVENPSALFLSERPLGKAGSVVVVTMEGTRPVLVEIQALISQSNYGVPRRTATGVDYNRLALLMAVLEKRRGFCLGNQDAFVNVVGGMRLTEPAVDLGVVVAVASSYLDKTVDPDIVVMGEVGLTGEIRNISQLEKRLTEAQKLGFRKCIIPKNNAFTQGTYKGMEVYPVSSIGEAIEIAMGGV